MLKSIRLAALCAMLATPLSAFDMSAMTDAERDSFRAEIRAYLLENPEVLLEAIGVLEAREAEEQAQNDLSLVADNAEALFNDGFSFVGGNPEGDITIVEFLDYRCGYCKRAHPEVKELIASDGNIRLILKEFPILGDQSVLASRFALGVKEVQGDDAYLDINDTLMTLRGEITEASLSNLSDSKGYDTPAVFAAMNGPKVQEAIIRTRELAQRLQINGTPSFVFETELLRGYAPLDTMRQVVEDLRAEG